MGKVKLWFLKVGFYRGTLSFSLFLSILLIIMFFQTIEIERGIFSIFWLDKGQVIHRKCIFDRIRVRSWFGKCQTLVLKVGFTDSTLSFLSLSFYSSNNNVFSNDRNRKGDFFQFFFGSIKDKVIHRKCIFDRIRVRSWVWEMSNFGF